MNPQSRDEFFLNLDHLAAMFSTQPVALANLKNMEDAFRRTLRALRDASLTGYDDVLDDVPPVVVPEASLSPAQIALNAAEGEWNRRIVEPRGGKSNGTADIVKYIKEGLLWKAPTNYKDGSFHWCGAFVAWCYAQAGMVADLRKYWLPSCNRMYYGHKDHGHWPRKNGGERVVYTDKNGGEIQPGDIVMVGDVGGPASGSHVTLCSGVHSDHITTWEGNAKGVLPDGTQDEGVVKQKRYFRPGNPQGSYIIKWAWRPTAEDLGVK